MGTKCLFFHWIELWHSHLKSSTDIIPESHYIIPQVRQTRRQFFSYPFVSRICLAIHVRSSPAFTCSFFLWFYFHSHAAHILFFLNNHFVFCSSYISCIDKFTATCSEPPIWHAAFSSLCLEIQTDEENAVYRMEETWVSCCQFINAG